MNSQVGARAAAAAPLRCRESFLRPEVAFWSRPEFPERPAGAQRARSGRAAGALRADRPTDFGLLDVDCYCMNSGQGVGRGAVPFAPAAAPSTRRTGERTRVALESGARDQFRPPRWGLLLHEHVAYA
jgi:hypothetical protein